MMPTYFDHVTCTCIPGVLELMEYTPPVVTEEDIKQFSQIQEQDFEEQVIVTV